MGSLRAAVAVAAFLVVAAGGASWTQSTFFVPGTIDGPLSLAVDRGSSPSPADDTVFLVVHFSDGAYLYSSPGGVLDFANAAGGVAIGTGHCGALLFDPNRRDLYLPCAGTARVAMIVGQVPLGQQVGLIFRTFVTPLSPGRGLVAELLPAAAVASKPVRATAYRWFGYAALVTGAASPVRSIVQQRFTAKPIHFGRVALGDPALGQYLGAALDADGGLVLAYDDTTSQHHAAHLFVTRQLAGPTALGTSIVEAEDQNPVSDPAGDAPTPQLDIRRAELVQDDPTRLRVLMTLAGPPAPDTPGLYLTRFQVLSTGVSGSASYRIVYLGARTGAGKGPAFFGGTTACADLACEAVSYPATVPAAGSIDGDTITVDVALEGGFGAGFPLNGDLLYNVVGLSFAPAGGVIGADIDSTAPFDYRLEERIGRTTGNGKHIVGAGSIRGASAGRATFSVDVFQAKRSEEHTSELQSHSDLVCRPLLE